jgi:ubiquinone/menaquinone biosynthesis C-methylase UbiE
VAPITPAAPHDPDTVLELFLSFWVARTVMAAVELGVFDLLGGDGMPEGEAARALGLPPRSARGVFDTCVAVGLLRRSGGRLRTTTAADLFLRSDAPYPLRNYVLDERWCWDAWGRLEEALRSDSPALPQDAEGYHTFPSEVFLDFLHGHSLWMGERLARAVRLDGVRRLMDLGGGSGAVAIALCRANPELEAVVVDRPPVLERAAEHVARAGLAGRITTRAANLFADPLPEGCDAALLANVLHDFSPERASVLLARTADALPSGGRLVVMEIAPDDDRSGPPLAAAFTVTMVVNTAGGMAYTRAELRELVEGAGFAVERETRIGERYVTTAIEARRR